MNYVINYVILQGVELLPFTIAKVPAKRVYKIMNNKIEVAITILAALLVLFTAMLDPKVSLALAALSLLALGIYHFVRK